MLYLPLGFWGFQVNLKTQEQKSVHTCRNAEGHPRGVFYTQTDPGYRNGGALLPPGGGTGGSREKGQPRVLCVQLPRAQTTCPGLEVTARSPVISCNQACPAPPPTSLGISGLVQILGLVSTKEGTALGTMGKAVSAVRDGGWRLEAGALVGSDAFSVPPAPRPPNPRRITSCTR